MQKFFQMFVNTNGLLLAIVCTSFPSAATAQLSAPVEYSIGTSPDPYIPNAAPASEIVHDFDGDAKLDLLVTHRTDESLYLLKGNGDGTFKPAVRIRVGAPIQGNIYSGDFNGDTKLDVFLPGAKGHAIILPGNGDGTFGSPIVSSSFNHDGYYPRGWAVGKFTSSGKLDVAFTLPTNSGKAARYGILLGNGDGTFKDALLSPGELVYSRWIASGDFNRDDRLDLAVADGHGTSSDPGTARMVVLLGNGDGTFKMGSHYSSPQFPSGDGWQDVNAVGHPENLVVADLTGRGILDVVVSDYSSTINIFMGNGDGTFQNAVSYNTGNYPRNVIPIDMNHDRKIDLVVTNVGIGIGGAIFQKVGAHAGSICVLTGNGDGTFQQPITYNSSAFPGYTVAADFNGDGLPDLATTQVFDGHSVHVMLNDPKNKNLPPVFVNPPSASLTGTTAQLSVLGDDDGGESEIIYAWSTVGPAPASVTYSANYSHDAQNAKATFAKSGTYVLQCKQTDKLGLSVTKLVVVKVP